MHAKITYTLVDAPEAARTAAGGFVVPNELDQGGIDKEFVCCRGAYMRVVNRKQGEGALLVLHGQQQNR